MNGGGCYQELSKKRSFLRLVFHKISRKFTFLAQSSSRSTIFQTKTSQFRKSRRFALLLPITSTLGILTLIATFFISADFASDSCALDGANLQSEVTASVDGTYYVTLSTSDINFSITPSSGITSDKQQANVNVTTNVKGGAELYLGMAGDTTALYLDGDTTSTARNIASATTETTYDNMVANTWGYSIDDITYGGVPAASSEAAIIANVNGGAVGTESGGVITGSVPVYFAAKVDTSIPSGSYANTIVYSAIVAGGVETTAELTSITVDGSPVEQLQLEQANTILVTTNLKTNTYGTPRVYYTTTSPSGYSECGNVVVSSNTDGYMTIQCTTTPTTVATGLTLHIVPKSSSEDTFCTDGTYEANSSECESGDWKWGSFTVVLPNIKGPVFNGIKTMQEMTPEICAAAKENDTTMLEDARDGKMYWVAKLADGNCWMTQNLELDLSTSTPLTSELSDVTSSWTPTNSTYTSTQNGNTSYTTVQSWNLGKYVWKTPDSTGNCSGSGVYDFSHSNCQSYWQDVSSWTPMTEYRTDGVTYDSNTQTYDAHYLAGNYYSWNAATANSTGSSSGTATQSICPKGFELPTSGDSFNSAPGSFYNLLNQYGFTSSTGSGTNSITRVPLFFIRSGWVTPSYYLSNAGYDGYYWSSVAPVTVNAYFLYFRLRSVVPSNVTGRYTGQSVRCVAPTA